ncbi:MarR family winged helix-turn-helix transcriptional regulator [Enterococcus rotai]|uniref:MarR family winged helix-turn-helix transcriptional regulator n=1 Tax=Enterococcus rotai TaxID=118060 RepID=UPI0032B4476D
MLNDCMNFLLSVSQHKVFKYYSKLLQEYNITPAQAGILTCLWSEKQLTPKEIGKRLCLEAPTISGLLDKMQKQELINREIDVNNRRIVFVTATEKADNMKPNIEKATKAMNQVVLSSFSDEEAILLKKFLNKIIHTELI